MIGDPAIPPTDTARGLDPRRGARLDIDLAAVADNYRRLRDQFTGKECAVAVKADAYGLGVAKVGPVLQSVGAKTFFVATLDEALSLRFILADARIAVLNGLSEGAVDDYLDQNIVPVLNHLGEVKAWSRIAAEKGRTLPAFIQLDTGMARLGLEPNEQARLSTTPDWLDGIEVLAWMSHLACADDPSHPLNADQRDRMAKAAALLPEAQVSLCNSAGIFLGPDYHFDIARPGCALYGISPTPASANPMRLTVRLSAPILQVRQLTDGKSVGYGASFVTDRPMRIATVPIGYADGFLRSMSNRGTTRVAGHPAPIVGRVSMDLITIDVTGVPENLAQPGQMVEVIGPHMPPDSVAELAGTIGYEVLTALGHRYDRHYHGWSG
ncbi:MAG: alanine racemase [Pseudomonadota bacterium]